MTSGLQFQSFCAFSKDEVFLIPLFCCFIIVVSEWKMSSKKTWITTKICHTTIILFSLNNSKKDSHKKQIFNLVSFNCKNFFFRKIKLKFDMEQLRWLNYKCSKEQWATTHIGLMDEHSNKNNSVVVALTAWYVNL